MKGLLVFAYHDPLGICQHDLICLLEVPHGPIECTILLIIHADTPNSESPQRRPAKLEDSSDATAAADEQQQQSPWKATAEGLVRQRSLHEGQEGGAAAGGGGGDGDAGSSGANIRRVLSEETPFGPSSGWEGANAGGKR